MNKESKSIQKLQDVNLPAQPEGIDAEKIIKGILGFEEWALKENRKYEAMRNIEHNPEANEEDGEGCQCLGCRHEREKVESDYYDLMNHSKQ